MSLEFAVYDLYASRVLADGEAMLALSGSRRTVSVYKLLRVNEVRLRPAHN